MVKDNKENNKEVKYDKNYEYHKQNEYPGERVAERKRVAERAEQAELKADARVANKGRADQIVADARVAEKGRTEELKADARVANKGRADQIVADARVAEKGRVDAAVLDKEKKRNAAREQNLFGNRNSANFIGITILALLIIGLGWSFSTNVNQSDEIQSLNNQVVSLQDSNSNQYQPLSETNSDGTQIRNAQTQAQLHNTLLLAKTDSDAEIKKLNEYNGTYENSYQLCANVMERTNNVNHAEKRYAENEITYYRQLTLISNKAHCSDEVDTFDRAIAASRITDENLYLENMKQCNRLSTQVNNNSSINNDERLMNEWQVASEIAGIRDRELTNSRNAVITCFS
jgi:hypothetical protein